MPSSPVAFRLDRIACATSAGTIRDNVDADASRITSGDLSSLSSACSIRGFSASH